MKLRKCVVDYETSVVFISARGWGDNDWNFRFVVFVSLPACEKIQERRTFSSQDRAVCILCIPLTFFCIFEFWIVQLLCCFRWNRRGGLHSLHKHTQQPLSFKCNYLNPSTWNENHFSDSLKKTSPPSDRTCSNNDVTACYNSAYSSSHFL